MCAVISRVRLFATPSTIAHQAPLSMGDLQARILQWVAMPSSKGIFPTQGLNPGFLHCRWILYRLSHQGNLGCLERAPKCWFLLSWYFALPVSGKAEGGDKKILIAKILVPCSRHSICFHFSDSYDNPVKGKVL